MAAEAIKGSEYVTNIEFHSQIRTSELNYSYQQLTINKCLRNG
jgi:hypothetical protein